MSYKRLVRSNNRVLGGVCGGIGEYLNIDPTIVRIAAVLVSIGSLGIAAFVYVLCWVLIPEW